MDERLRPRTGLVSDERGGIVGGWLLRLTLFMAVVALVVYELMAIVVTHVGLDDAGREVARAARDEYRASGSIERTTGQAERVAETHGVDVASVARDGEDVVVELEATADTLLVHRLGPTQDWTTATHVARVGGGN